MNPLVIGLICVGMAVAAQAVMLTALERIFICAAIAFLSHAYVAMATTCIISLIIQAVWAIITRPSKPPQYRRPVTDWLDLR